MSVIVKGMKMPKNCLHCDFDDSYGICACKNEAPYVCEYSAKQRPSWCPLEEVPSAQPEKRTEERTETHACDLIDRQAAIDVLGKYKVEHGYAYYDCACEIENDLKQISSAQPDLEEAYICGETEAEARFHAEIVLCKDCKYYQTRQKSGFLPQCCWFDVLTKPNDFCSNGRKENR